MAILFDNDIDYLAAGSMVIGIGEFIYEGYTWLVDGVPDVNTICNTLDTFCTANTTEWIGLNKILVYVGDASIGTVGLVLGTLILVIANLIND